MAKEAVAQGESITKEEMERIEQTVKDNCQNYNNNAVNTGLVTWNPRGLAKKAKKGQDLARRTVKGSHLLRITGVNPRDFIFIQAPQTFR